MQLFLSTFLLFSLQLFSMTILESLFLLSDSRQFVPFIFLGMGCGGALQLVGRLRSMQQISAYLVPVTFLVVVLAFFLTSGAAPPMAALFMAFSILGFLIAGNFRKGHLSRLYVVDMSGALLGTVFYFVGLPYLGGEKALIVLLLLSCIVPFTTRWQGLKPLALLVATMCLIVPLVNLLPVNFLFIRPAINLPGSENQNSFKNAFESIRTKTSDYIMTAWSPLGRVDLLKNKESGAHWLYYNNVTFATINTDMQGYTHPHRVLPNMDSVLVIGAGGGTDVLQLRLLGYKNITALEINKGTIEIMDSPYVRGLTDNLYDSAWYLDQDARAFMERGGHQYALITNTFTELVYERNSPTIFYQNYIFTVEGTEAIWNSLVPNGVALWLRTAEGEWFHSVDAYRTVLTIREMLQRKNLNPLKHLVIVHNSENGENIIWLKKDVWAEGDYGKYFSNLEEHNYMIFPSLQGPLTRDAKVIRAILIDNMSAEDFFKKTTSSIAPVTDDQPYLYFHLKYDNWLYFYLSFFIAYLVCVGVTGFHLMKRNTPAQAQWHQLGQHIAISLIGFGAGLLQTSLMYDTAFLFKHPTYSIVCILVSWLIGGLVGSVIYKMFDKKWLWIGISVLNAVVFLALWSQVRGALIRGDSHLQLVFFILTILPSAALSSGWFLYIMEKHRQTTDGHEGLVIYFLSSMSLVAGSGLCAFLMFHLGVRNSVYLAQVVFLMAFIILLSSRALQTPEKALPATH